MSHTLIIRHLKTDNSQPTFTVQRQADGKQSDQCALNDPQTITVEGRPGSNLRYDLRWYLEHFLDYPHEPNTGIANRVQAALKTWGEDCFRQLFAGRARDWYQDARRAGLAQLTVKIASDDPAVLAWPWEALRDPEGSTLAHACRIERQLSELHDSQPLPDHLATDQVNILLVIARPYDNDVGYHALSRPIVEQAKQHRWPVHIDVLRPPTFEQLREVLHAKSGFYHIVHFDGHGGYGGVGATGPHAFQSKQGQLIFETITGEEAPISADKLTTLLTECGVPIMVLNACQSAAIDEDAEDPFGSVAAALLKAGIRSVVAMGYHLYVSAAQQFVPAFYQRLLENGDVADAVRAGRQAMLGQDARICATGAVPLQDWLVPVLYQQDPYTLQTTARSGAKMDAQQNVLPEAATSPGDYGFIGRERAIQALEAACLRQPQAGILIHGMAGIGKTTLAQGFLQWLQDTHGLQGPVVWLSFDDIRSAEYVINRLVETVFEHAATALLMDQKLPALIQALRERSLIIVWDNFESAAGIVDVESAFLSTDDQALLKQLLGKLRGGKSKILITSRASENQLTQTECFRLPLGGLQGEECWMYCEAVVLDLGLRIDRSQAVYSELMKELAGHPLAMRAVLLRLTEKSADALLAELKTEFVGAQGDDSTRRIFAALSLLDQGLPAEFRPVLQLIGLHQRFVVRRDIESILKAADSKSDIEVVQHCFTALERGGLLHQYGQANYIYNMHPLLNHYCAQRHTAGDALKRKFVGIMGFIVHHFTLQEQQEQRIVFTLHRANIYQALALLKDLDGLDMEDCFEVLTQGLAIFSKNLRDFSNANQLYASLAEHFEKVNKPTEVAGMYHNQGMIAEEQRDFIAAEMWYQKSLAINEKQDNKHGIAKTYHHLGKINEEQRNFTTATTCYLICLAIEKKQGCEHGLASTYHQLGRIAYKQNDHAAAEMWCQKSLTSEKENESGAALTYHLLGIIAHEQRNFGAAETWYHKSLDIKRKQDDEYGAASTYHQLGVIAQEKCDFAIAETWYQKSLAIKEKQGNEHGAALSYAQLGMMAAAQRDVITAGAWYLRAIAGLGDDQLNLGLVAWSYLSLLQAASQPNRTKLKTRWQTSNLALPNLNDLEKQFSDH